VYDPRADPGADVVLLAPALRRGLDQEEFTVAYQPIVRLADEGIDHYEALLRWTTPTGPVSPDSFVTVAERTGLVGDLGRYALERALAELAAIRAAGRDDVGMSVNLSVRQLAEDGLAELIATLLDRYELPAPCVTMEVTEGVLLNATGRGWDALDGVRGLGVQIALDDFGTGYSQLPYLRQFDFDEIKIDQSFVAAMHEDLRAKALIAGAIAFAHVAGMRVVAEGIERREQAEELRELGCTHGQGYLFGAATRSPSANGRRRPRPGSGAQPGVDHQRE
jgi:EAL domain-containing protein (putative c-di-GMP-specific phosphodiesterase class I)